MTTAGLQLMPLRKEGDRVSANEKETRRKAKMSITRGVR